jgi:DNA-directed RNA polymerase I subunit RPA12
MGEARRQALRIGSLLFCPACGTLLDLPKDEQDEIECHSCGRREPASCEYISPSTLEGTRGKLMIAYENLPTTTYSSPQAFPSSLRSKRALVQNTTTEEQAAKSKDTIVSYVKFVMTRADWNRVTRVARNARSRV